MAAPFLGLGNRRVYLPGRTRCVFFWPKGEECPYSSAVPLPEISGMTLVRGGFNPFSRTVIETKP
jgi:hypothetical protein